MVRNNPHFYNGARWPGPPAKRQCNSDGDQADLGACNCRVVGGHVHHEPGCLFHEVPRRVEPYQVMRVPAIRWQAWVILALLGAAIAAAAIAGAH